ncbi:MAG: hypothetical protein ACE5FP_00510 [Gemmatimonadota bacterium]
MTTCRRTSLTSAGAAVLFLVLAPGAEAQERSDSGSFSFSVASSEQMPLSDATVLMRVVQSGMVLTADPDSPLNRSATTCSGSTVASAETASIAGYCDMVDVDGDVWTAWYRGDQDGGVWGFLVGTGKFEGVQGEGTFRAGEVWADGRGINYWDATYTLP